MSHSIRDPRPNTQVWHTTQTIYLFYVDKINKFTSGSGRRDYMHGHWPYIEISVVWAVWYANQCIILYILMCDGLVRVQDSTCMNHFRINNNHTVLET